MDEEEYKSLLIVNESRDAQVTLYLYPKWDFICWISFSSKIIRPGEKYLHRSKDEFKFQLVARFEDKPKRVRTLLEVETWVEDKLLKITESLHLTERKLADFPVEKRICLRKVQRDKELKTTNGRRNLYEILGLDMAQVRKMPREKQNEAIKKGFQQQIKRWHPDKNFGDAEIAKEIIMAQIILLDEEKRAQYNNEADYDGGWLSLKRYKAILNPERFTEEQKKAYSHRMLMFFMSLGISIVGIVLTFETAGLAAGASVAIGAVFTGAFTGGGLLSLQHTVSKKSVVEGCDKKQWLSKAGIGFAAGAAIGGAAVGITAGVAGLGSSAMESAAVTAGQYMEIGAGTGAVGGAISSLASDAGRKFVDGEEVTWKQAVGHAACGATIGAAAGAAGGAVSKAFVGSQTSAASATLETEVGEQILIMTGGRRLANTLARNISRELTESGVEAVMGTTAQFAEERLDDSVENQSPGKHFVSGVTNLAGNAVKCIVREGSGALSSHVWNEIKVSKRVKYNKLETPLVDIDDETNRNVVRGQVRQELFEEQNEHLIKCPKSKCSAKYQPLETDKPTELPTVYDEDGVVDKQESDQPGDGKIKYISEGAWLSKMIVSFVLDGNETAQEVSGSRMFVTIPSRARCIVVRFKVSRPFWGDIMKYDRFEKSWCRPYEPHVFRYDKPPNRTFTISGNLWWEAIMAVTDEYHEETKEM